MSGPPPGFDPSISRLPDPGPSAAPMVAMSGGGSGSSNNNSLITITILGESYRIRKVITAYPLLEEENRVLEAFLVDPDNHKIPDKTVFEFFYALATYNCEKEVGVLLNPKCEPVRAILRSTLLTAIKQQPRPTPKPEPNLEPTAESCASFLLFDEVLKRRNKLNVDIYLYDTTESDSTDPTDPTDPTDKTPINECLFLLDGLLKSRSKLNMDINLCERTETTSKIECLLLLDRLLKRRNKLIVDVRICA